MADGDAIAALLVAGPFPPRAALEAADAICTALDAHQPTLGGRPLGAGAVLLFADGDVILQDTAAADAAAVAQLMVHMLLGRPPSATDVEGALHTLLEALQADGCDQKWTQRLMDLLRACLSSSTSERPSIHRIQQRCADLARSAAGPSLQTLIPQRMGAARSWMDMPPPAQSSPFPPPPVAPQSSPLPNPSPIPPAPVAPQPRPQRARPSTPPPPPSDPWPWKLIAVLAGGAALLIAVVVIGQLSAPPPPPPAPPSPEEPGTHQLTEKYKLDSNEHQLAVESDPPGAQVTVDGTVVGITPMQLHELTAGVHRISLTLDELQLEQTMMVDQNAHCTWFTTDEETPWRCETSGNPW